MRDHHTGNKKYVQQRKPVAEKVLILLRGNKNDSIQDLLLLLVRLLLMGKIPRGDDSANEGLL